MDKDNKIMDRYITPAQRIRILDIDNILKRYNEIDIPDNIIHKINKKFKTTKYYNFIRTEEIATGMIIRCVDLDMNKISLPGIVVNINNGRKKDNIITLYNSSQPIYWKINPDKYYIFEVISGNNNAIREFAEKRGF